MKLSETFDPESKKHISLSKRFWSKVEVKEGCWKWFSAKNEHGYGRMTAGRKVNLKAHRVSYYLHNGPIKNGLCVLHACDNPECTNSDHLFLGTKKDNTHDMMKKGRMVPPPVNWGNVCKSQTKG